MEVLQLTSHDLTNEEIGANDTAYWSYAMPSLVLAPILSGEGEPQLLPS